MSSATNIAQTNALSTPGRRTAVDLGAEDFQRPVFHSNTAARWASLAARQGRAQRSRPSAFMYVVKSASGLVTIGVAVDPIERLFALQIASKETLELVYAAAVLGNYAHAVEQVARSMLRHHRLNGEWLEATSELAVAAIAAASRCLNDPVVEVPGKFKAIIETDIGKVARLRRSRCTLATLAVAITTVLLFISVWFLAT